MFPPKVVTARWPKHCMWCLNRIATGERYQRQAWVDGCGSAGTHLSCLACAEQGEPDPGSRFVTADASTRTYPPLRFEIDPNPTPDPGAEALLDWMARNSP